MFEIGRMCVKIAGRDAGKKCVIVDVLENNYVIIDGETRRRKCNINHLEPLDQDIKIAKKASHDAVVSEFKKLELEPRATKPKQKTERPRAKRKTPEQLREGREKKKEERKKTVEKLKEAKEAGIEEKIESEEKKGEVKGELKKSNAKKEVKEKSKDKK